ncbi:hypothetical protein GE21DRAFT_1196561 [Neurospora crassa]|nr:hypothetical protein GE21DRAFT_1196561 [Neurospora crassa]
MTPGMNHSLIARRPDSGPARCGDSFGSAKRRKRRLGMAKLIRCIFQSFRCVTNEPRVKG